MKRERRLAWGVLVGCLWSSVVWAQGSDIERRLQSQVKAEPTVAEVQAQALTYFRVHPDRVSSLRNAASWKAMAPIFEVSGGCTNAQVAEDTILDEYSRTTPWVVRGAGGQAFEVRGKLAWDLPKLVFNAEELDVTALALTQRDVLLQVTQIYFMRRRLQLDMLTDPAVDAEGQLNRDLRVAELTALLSALTGGWFGERIAATEPGATAGTIRRAQ